MDIIIKAKDKPVVDEMAEFLKTLTEEEQQQISLLIKGIKLGIALKVEDKPKSA